MFDPVSLLALFAPTLIDAGKALVNRYITPEIFKPSTIEEYTKVREVDLNLFKAINDAGGTNPTYMWVEAVIRLMRPSVAIIVIGTWAYFRFVFPEVESLALDTFAAAIGFYLFADRTLFYSSKKK